MTGTCIDCGHESELILSPRFPHICSRCLFPPAGPRGMVQALMTGVQRRKHARKATANDAA